jgi:hypothetical protein
MDFFSHDIPEDFCHSVSARRGREGTKAMKKLCSEVDANACHALLSRLAEQGIPCLVKDNSEPSLFPEPASSPHRSGAELWILEDSDFETAWALLSDLGHPAADAASEEPSAGAASA